MKLIITENQLKNLLNELSVDNILDKMNEKQISSNELTDFEKYILDNNLDISDNEVPKLFLSFYYSNMDIVETKIQSFNNKIDVILFGKNNERIFIYYIEKNILTIPDYIFDDISTIIQIDNETLNSIIIEWFLDKFKKIFKKIPPKIEIEFTNNEF